MYHCRLCNYTCDMVGTRIREILDHEKTHEEITNDN